MAWRVIQHGGGSWLVSMAAERRANSPYYHLVFSFRRQGSDRQPIWAAYPLTSPSKAALFAQADRLRDGDLAAFLAEHVSEEC